MRRVHSVVIQPREKFTGTAGQDEERDVGGPLPPLRVNFHPLTSEEIQFWGDGQRETGKLFCDSWPADVFARVTFRGHEWDVLGIEKADIGLGTRHDEVVIRRR